MLQTIGELMQPTFGLQRHDVALTILSAAAGLAGVSLALMATLIALKENRRHHEEGDARVDALAWPIRAMAALALAALLSGVSALLFLFGSAWAYHLAVGALFSLLLFAAIAVVTLYASAR